MRNHVHYFIGMQLIIHALTSTAVNMEHRWSYDMDG